MTVERIHRPDWVGCVVGVATGVFDVLTDRGTVRASLDGCMLARVAGDRSCLPDAGDWVELCRWPDGRVTVRRTLRAALAPVVDLSAARRRRRG